MFNSTKNKIRLLVGLVISFVLLIIVCFQWGTFAIEDQEKLNPESYWSVKNAPIFYGASKITFAKGAISSFDYKDTRFRIFAKDFEDGDLTPNIVAKGNVDVNKAGTYNIEYKVTDSHNNTTSLTVPVIVTDSNSKDINVERILYTNPSTWAVSLGGFSRGDSGDRQILGIYLKASETAKMRILEADNNISVNFMANDSHIESGVTIPKDGSWVTLKNTKNNVDYDSVPVLTSTILSKNNNSLTKTFKIELVFDSSISELDYYHYKDDESEFRNNWKESQNTFGVVENEVMTVIVPFADLDKTTNFYRNGFKSLDQFLEYYKAAVDKMDEYTGLKLNPEKLTDQNVRLKYLVKANAHGAGAAYYAGNHVGINKASVASFFEMNWGGLHEFAHGYQGNLGKGQMGLGEVGNNIIGHYIQIDKSIYFHNGDWLGALKNIEDKKNASRENGSKFSDVDVSTRLYMIINLFDYFEGGTTYGKMFSWFREHRNDSTLKVDVNANQDIYVLALADIYHINVIPYMEAWGLNISSVVKDEVYKNNYKSVTILKDMVTSDSLNEVMQSSDINLKYKPVLNDIYQDNNINGSLKVTFDIDNISSLMGKNMVIKDGEKIIKTVRITGKEMSISLPVGNYLIQMPVLNEYKQDNANVTIKESEETKYTYKYEKLDNVTYDNDLYIRVLGYNFDTIGYQLSFSNQFTNATITYPNQSAMGGKEYVRIYDNNNKLVDDETVTNGYFNFNKGSRNITLKEGYIIEINYPSRYARKVKVYSSLTNQEIIDYTPTTVTTRYIVTKNGLKLENMADEKVEEISYNNLKNHLIKIIEDYQKVVTIEELENKNINFKVKSDVLAAYNNLKPNDRDKYTSLINSIKKGGSPKVKTVKDTKFKLNTNVNLYSLIAIEDNEDGTITPTEENVKIVTNLDTSKAGIYPVNYQVKDSDGNITNYKIDVEITSSGTTSTTTKKPTTSTTTTKKITTSIKPSSTTTTKKITTSVKPSSTTTKITSTSKTTTSIKPIVKPTEVITTKETTTKKNDSVITSTQKITTSVEVTSDNKVDEVVDVPATSANSTLIKIIGLVITFISLGFIITLMKKDKE